MEEGLEERTNRLLRIFVPLGIVAVLVMAFGAFLMLRPKGAVPAP